MTSLGDRYLDITYGSKPLTDYPTHLAKYLAKRYRMQVGDKLLDIGCGRGELSEAFAKLGLQVTAIDQASPTIHDQGFTFIKRDFVKDGLGVNDESFDFIFSKSVIEHLYYPEKMLLDARQALALGGTIITMTPSWKHNIKIFFDDFTHRTPFTLNSLSEIHQYAGLNHVNSEYFVQLPMVWERKFLKNLSRLAGYLIPSDLRNISKTMRFSKEIMLLASAKR